VGIHDTLLKSLGGETKTVQAVIKLRKNTWGELKNDFALVWGSAAGERKAQGAKTTARSQKFKKRCELKESQRISYWRGSSDISVIELRRMGKLRDVPSP